MSIILDKKTNRISIDFRYKGVRHKEHLPAGTTKEDAKKLEIKIKNDLMFQSHGIDTQAPMTFAKFIEDIYGPHAETYYSPERFTRTTQIVAAAMPYLKGKLMKRIKAADLERFKASRIDLPTLHKTMRKPATVEREMAIISSIFAMAVKNDVIDYNPCSRVSKLKYDNVQDRILRREDEAKFFANMHSPWARDVCRFALYTGLRQNDIMNLTRFQVDIENALITLIQGKTKRRVEIALNAVAIEILERRMKKGNEYLFASPVTKEPTGSVRHAMMRACIRAKIPVITIRDLRRTNATRKIENGADAVTVARSLGHSSLKMIPRYVRSLDAMRKAADSLVNYPVYAPAAKNLNRKVLKIKQ